MPSVRFISSLYQTNQLKHVEKNVHLTRYSGSIDSSTKIGFFKMNTGSKHLPERSVCLKQLNEWLDIKGVVQSENSVLKLRNCF